MIEWDAAGQVMDVMIADFAAEPVQETRQRVEGTASRGGASKGPLGVSGPGRLAKLVLNVEKGTLPLRRPERRLGVGLSARLPNQKRSKSWETS